ncbi:MAG: 3-dehydroquinate synthase [Gammaproteobacteria bacterium]
MKKIIVELGDRSYPIYAGNDLLGKGNLLLENVRSKQIMIVSNTTVAPLYLETVMQALQGMALQGRAAEGLEINSVILPDGEQYKTLDAVNDIITALLDKRYGRNSCLVALGGGVIGDITGFAAACYQRGIDYIQIPTTVLAQVDSSVGGKTGVNHAAGKNMIGAFHQPRAVIADISVLDTLNNREVSAGLAEVVKYGLIRDEKFFDWLEENIEQLLNRETEALAYIIEQSCKNKAAVVAEDERESGLRAILNLGHTFGHAIETGIGYGEWLHGEAIALGMLMAADLSHRQGWITEEVIERIKQMLVKLNLPVALPDDLDPGKMRELMSVDKKAKDGVLFLILLKGIGEAVVTDEYDEDLLMETLHHFSADETLSGKISSGKISTGKISAVDVSPAERNS